jgi:hypothetical protein
MPQQHQPSDVRRLTHASVDVHVLRSLTCEEQRELRDRGVCLNPPLVRADRPCTEGYYRD